MKLKSQTDNGFSIITDRPIVCFFSRYTGLIVVFELLLIFCTSLFAQSNLWPEYLSLPDTTDVATATTEPFHIKSIFLTNDILKSNNSITYVRDSNDYLFEQHLDYNVTNYLNGVQNHYAGLSGVYKRNNIFKTTAALGIDWTPEMYYYKSENTGDLQGQFDIGPVFNYSVWKIPVSIRAGGSAFGWNDKLDRTSGLLKRDNYDALPGYYGEVTIGDSVKRWFNLPLIFNVDVLGKEIGGKGLGVVTSSLKAAFSLQSGDSIFFHAGDSLSNGKKLYDAGSSTLYSTTPWKIEHKLALSGALRGKERFNIRPAVLYDFSLKDISYPVLSSLLDDVRVTENGFGFQAVTGDGHRLTYSGGISFRWNTTDRIYKETDSQISSDESKRKQSVNLGDCEEYIASTDHDVSLHLPHGITLNYQLHCYRNSQSYPYKYDTLVNQEENDQIRNLNHAGILYTRDSVASLEVYGELAKKYSYYYRKTASGKSMTSDYYKVGINTDCNIKTVRVTEAFFATAEKSDYKFKSVHKGENFSPPPYNRRLSSALSIVWTLNDMWSITGKWNETYSDDGKWYGEEYFDRLHQSDSIYNLYHGTYGIETKSMDYSLQMIVSWTFNQLLVNAGFLFRDNSMEEYDLMESRFKQRNTGEGHVAEPSLEAGYQFSKGYMKMKVSRKFTSEKSEKNKFSKNWNLGLGVETAF